VKGETRLIESLRARLEAMTAVANKALTLLGGCGSKLGAVHELIKRMHEIDKQEEPEVTGEQEESTKQTQVVLGIKNLTEQIHRIESKMPTTKQIRVMFGIKRFPKSGVDENVNSWMESQTRSSIGFRVISVIPDEHTLLVVFKYE